MAMAASVLAISFVCIDTGSADPHLVGSHEHASTHHASGRDSDHHSAVAPLVGHLECSDVTATAAAGTCLVKICLEFGPPIDAVPDATTRDRQSSTRVRVWTGPPPPSRLSASPLRI